MVLIMLPDIDKMTGGKCQQHDGIWTTKTNEEISYPDSANADCRQIEEQSYWFQHRNSIITSLLAEHASLDEQSFFTDIGGGNGFQSKAIQDTGLATVLVEPGLTGCVNAKNRGVKTVVHATLEASGLRDESVPLAGAFDVVEHIEDESNFLGTAFKKLKTDGLFFMTVPALSILWSDEDSYAGHFRRYTVKSACRSLATQGFKIEFASYIFKPLVLPIFLLRATPYRLGISKGVDIQKTTRQHTLPNNPAGRLVNRGLKKELELLQRMHKQRIGTSVVVVARKP